MKETPESRNWPNQLAASAGCLHRAARLAGACTRIFKRLAAAVDLLNSFSVAFDSRRAARGDRRFRAGWHALRIQVCVGAADGSRASAIAFGTAARLGNHHPDSPDRRNSCSGIEQSKTQLASDGRAGGGGRISIGEPGYRDRCLAGGEHERGSAGSRGSHDSAGYRIGMLVSGAGSLFDRSYAGWFAAYATMAALRRGGTRGVFAGSGTEGAGGNVACCGIRLACGSPRVFEGCHQSLSRFHAAAALARHSDRHLRIQAGRGNGGSDVDASLYIVGIFSS